MGSGYDNTYDPRPKEVIEAGKEARSKENKAYVEASKKNSVHREARKSAKTNNADMQSKAANAGVKQRDFAT